MTVEELKKFDRERYEIEKEDLINFFNEQEYDKKYLKPFLINSMKNNFAVQLKEDNLLYKLCSCFKVLLDIVDDNKCYILLGEK